MKYFVNIIFFFCFVGNVASQQRDYKLIPYSDGNKWGYMNRTHEIIIEPTLDTAYLLEVGDSTITATQNHDTITIIIPTEYIVRDKKVEFNRELSGSSKAYVDSLRTARKLKNANVHKQEQIITKETYDSIYVNDSAYILYYKDGYDLYLHNKKRDFPRQRNPIVQVNGKYGIISTTGRVILPIEYEIVDEIKCVLTNYYAPYEKVLQKTNWEGRYFQAKKNGRYALFSFSGTQLTPFNFGYIRYISSLDAMFLYNEEQRSILDASGRYFQLDNIDSDKTYRKRKQYNGPLLKAGTGIIDFISNDSLGNFSVFLKDTFSISFKYTEKVSYDFKWYKKYNLILKYHIDYYKYPYPNQDSVEIIYKHNKITLPQNYNVFDVDFFDDIVFFRLKEEFEENHLYDTSFNRLLPNLKFTFILKKCDDIPVLQLRLSDLHLELSKKELLSIKKLASTYNIYIEVGYMYNFVNIINPDGELLFEENFDDMVDYNSGVYLATKNGRSYYVTLDGYEYYKADK